MFSSYLSLFDETFGKSSNIYQKDFDGMNSYRDFLKNIGRDDDHLILRTYMRNRSGDVTMKTITYEDVEEENKQHCVYFVPGIGGTKADEIKMFTSAYIDFDAGRPKDDDGKIISGEYFSPDVVQQFKAKALSNLHHFPLQFTIVETRNGFHAYLPLAEPIDPVLWKKIQTRLWVAFDGDEHVAEVHQPMRLPYTFWRKPKHEPFYVTVIEHHEEQYTPDQILAALSFVTDEVIEQKREERRRQRRIEQRGRTHVEAERNQKVMWSDGVKKPCSDCTTTPMIEAIRSGDVVLLQSILRPEPMKKTNYGELIEFLTKEVDLFEFLGLKEGPVLCPFHADTKPSAGVTTLDTGEQFFRCFACGIRGNIRAIVQHIRGCSPAQAVRFLKLVLKVALEETDWQREHRENLQCVKRILDGELMDQYPVLHANVKNDLLFLSKLIDIAMDNLYDERFTTVDGSPVVFASFRHLAKVYGAKHHNTVSRKVINLALHNLIQRLPDAEVPEVLLERSRQYQRRHRGQVVGHRINYFSIPYFSPTDLLQAEKTAEVVQNSGLTREGYSYDGIYRTFGEEVADQVFVQHEGDGPTNGSNARTEEMHDFVLETIESRGWVYESEIIEWLTQMCKKTKARTQTKNSLPEMLSLYGLESVRLTKELKAQLGIEDNGYKKIIRRQSVTTGDEVANALQ